MKIVFLDSLTANRGDLDFSVFAALGELVHYDTSTPEDVLERLKDAEIVVTNKVKLGEQHFSQCPKLKLVCVLATGYDVIDLAQARNHGVTVCNVPAYGSDSVAQTTFALLLELTHHIGEHSRLIKEEGAWTKSPTFSFWKYPLVELANKTMLIVGHGNIGKKVEGIAKAFGMNILLHSIELPDSAPLDTALPRADVVSFHCPLTPETRGMVNTAFLKQLKPSAFIINTSRGGLINEAEMLEALTNKTIAGFACDVLSQEPPPADHPLLRAPNCIISSHLAWATLESRVRCWNICAENIRAFIAGKAINVV